MTLQANPVVIGGALFLVAAVALVLTTGRTDKRLRERLSVMSAVRLPADDLSPATILEAEKRRSIGLRLAEQLGYRPGLPAPYAPSLKTTLPIAGVVAIVVWKLFEAVLPPFPSGAIGLLAGIGATGFMFRRKNVAYRAMLFRQIPDTLSLMLRAVRAGLPIAEAIKSVSRESMTPTREEFTRVAAETALGMPIELTLRRLSDRTQIQEYAFFSVVIGLHGQTGGNLSETIENLADMVRRRVAMAGKAKALAAEGRLSAVVVGALPFVVGGLISCINPDYMSEFVENPTGKVLILAFFILLSLGLFTTNWITKRSTQD